MTGRSSAACGLGQAATHESRARALLIGDEPSMAAIARALPDRVVLADDLFDAVARIAAAPARQPILAAVLTADTARGLSRDAEQAIRRLDPALRLAVLDSPGASPASANGPPAPGGPGPSSGEAARFDERIGGPLIADHVLRLLGEDPADVSPSLERRWGPRRPQPSGCSADGGVPAPPGEPGGGQGAAVGRSKDQPSTPAPDGSKTAMDSAKHPPAAETSRDASAADSLGDTDLVRAILRDPAGVRDVALRLMIEQTGWDDLSLDDDEDIEGSHGSESRGAAEALVEHEGRCFGVLRSRRADADQLPRWAAWLGAWLALDTSYREHRYMAFHDELTGAHNRRYFQRFLGHTIREAARQRRPVTVMVLDIDDFKHYNDAYGHAAGDVILRETVRLLRSVIRRGDRVCRLGGDEFAVVFADPEPPREPGSQHPEGVERIAQRFQAQVCAMKFPKLGIEAPDTLSVSAGLATYPWDAPDAEALLAQADELALQSKQRGKNAITLGPGAQRICAEDAPGE